MQCYGHECMHTYMYCSSTGSPPISDLHLPPLSPSQVYAEPLGYWRNYYNLFDFFILLISVVQTILSALQIGHTGVVLLRVVRGEGQGWE